MDISWRNSALGTLSLVVAAIATSCGVVKTDVDVVRNGLLADYNTTTVGKALEGTFQNAKWSSFVTPKGVTIVQFDATVPAGRLGHRDAASLALGGNYPTENACISSLGLAEPLAILKRQADNSLLEYRAEVKTTASQFQGLGVPEWWVKGDSGDQPEPSVNISGQLVYPLHDLLIARQSQRNAEAQALAKENSKVADCMNNTSVPVKLQFALSADKKTFELGYVDEALGTREQALTFIYR
jgi:hypothetical protein